MIATRSLLGLVVALALAPVCIADAALEKALDKKVSISHAKVTLQQALAELSEHAGIKIKILKNDLTMEGITQNQCIAIDIRDKPAREVLIVILGKADPKWRLAYVIQEPGTVVITTRPAAEKRKEVPLPLVS